VLGTASQTPTRSRHHNGYFVRWDTEGLLFDPGEGTQRQLLMAGVSPWAITRILLTHLHGDHCLGLPGVVQRMSLERVAHQVDLVFPRSGLPFVDRLLHASVFDDCTDLVRRPVAGPGTVVDPPPFTIVARRLEHRPETFGYRVEEPAGRTILRRRLDELGLEGPAIGELQRGTAVRVGTRMVSLDEVSVERPGQVLAFVMDTALCDAAFELAAGADLLVCEATFADADAALAAEFNHMTASQAGRLAAESGARRLVVTHFSQRYPDPEVLASEARLLHPDVVVARELLRVPVPPRRAGGRDRAVGAVQR